MLQVKCTQIFRDSKGKIFGYRLKDLAGKEVDVKPDNLKQAIKAGKLNVINLTLTSDNRLMRKEAKSNLKGVGSAPVKPIYKEESFMEELDKIFEAVGEKVKQLGCKDAEYAGYDADNDSPKNLSINASIINVGSSGDINDYEVLIRLDLRGNEGSIGIRLNVFNNDEYIGEVDELLVESKVVAPLLSQKTLNQLRKACDQFINKLSKWMHKTDIKSKVLKDIFGGTKFESKLNIINEASISTDQYNNIIRLYKSPLTIDISYNYSDNNTGLNITKLEFNIDNKSDICLDRNNINKDSINMVYNIFEKIYTNKDNANSKYDYIVDNKNVYKSNKLARGINCRTVKLVLRHILNIDAIRKNIESDNIEIRGINFLDARTDNQKDEAANKVSMADITFAYNKKPVELVTRTLCDDSNNIKTIIEFMDNSGNRYNTVQLSKDITDEGLASLDNKLISNIVLKNK